MILGQHIFRPTHLLHFSSAAIMPRNWSTAARGLPFLCVDLDAAIVQHRTTLTSNYQKENMRTVQTNCCKPLLLNTLNGESSLAAKQLLRASPCVRIACDVLSQKGQRFWVPVENHGPNMSEVSCKWDEGHWPLPDCNLFRRGNMGGSFISSLAVLCCHSKLRPVFGSRIQRKRIQNQIFTTHPWWRKHGAFKCRGAPFEMLGGIWWDVRNVWLLLLWPLKIGEGLRAYHFSPGASTRHFWW